MIEQILQDQNIQESSVLQSCKLIFGITFRQTIRSKRTVFVLILTFLPVVIAVFYRIFAARTPIMPGDALLSIMLFFMQFLSVLVALSYATALVADEIDNKTITYLFTRPVRKYSIILGKFAAYLLEVLVILAPPILLTFVIIATDSRILNSFTLSLSVFGRRFGVIVLGLIVYGAIFTFFGVWWKRPVLLGLVFAFGWEKVVIFVPGALRKFSIIHYLMSLFPGAEKLKMGMPGQLIPITSAPLSITILLIIAIVFIVLSMFVIHRKEYKFE